MRLTFHGTLLGVILLLLAMMALGPARQLYQEHKTIAADQRTLAAGSAEAGALTARIQAMQDPKHIEQLARQELGYVRPGETSYIIQRPQASPTSTATAKSPDRSWLKRAWHGVTSIL